MLIIEKNAVYEVDCECLQKKRGRYANLTDYCANRRRMQRITFLYRKRRNGSHFGYRPISAS